MTLQEAYLFYSNKLEKTKIDNPRLETRIIIKYSLKIKDLDFIVNPNLVLTNNQLSTLQNVFSKRLKGIPLSYILNSQFFWKNDFYVNENVLIPRQDSETLIESVLKYYPNKLQSLSILEIGVGSGCLILSLLSEYIHAKGVGVDISTNAIDVCFKNAQNMGLKERLKLLQSNILESVQGKFDVIISNPPYIDENDAEIAEDVKKFEPSLALFAKNNGLYFYEKILQDAKKYMAKGGMLFLEIGYTQNNDVIKLSEKNGFSCVETSKDLSNKDRVVILRIES